MNTRKPPQPVAPTRETPRSSCRVPRYPLLELDHYPKPSLRPLILAALLLWSAVGVAVWYLYTLTHAA